ncbi:lactate dehydrogenase-like oxidoreductase [Desulfitobacterium dichloroeliminans LMG P-21439]|uniref:Glyoxylate/hydroxypyruvate reductase B n=1 Tax=Desulfitobacterium dichloroeliminans (strain LMG P-21439 / DCA1) TaxID=871963 RepID=L0F6B9_DESDL|nr:D-glycerate dehydrogenase [Desulfitobacterium dichloroeliminans]AGA69389.1 lactate dehydrogenase-like oxidoreductase [Desulfitobacterium dichloroeliminans LMG P-21439]
MKPKIFITRQIPEDILAMLQETCEVKLWSEADVPVPRDVLEQEIRDVEGLYCLLTESIDDSLLAQAKNLRIVSNMAVGYNNINVEAATRRKILVTNTPGVLTETTADLTFALLMMTARRMEEASQFLRQGQWKTWSPMLLAGQDVYGATIGIIGMGRIGEAVAKRAKGFDMKIIYHNRTRKFEIEERLGAQYRTFEELLEESDFVCILTPSTPETQNLIGKTELERMKPTAILINTARGGIVNEDDLYSALMDQKIYAAGLDVFSEEPLSPQHPLLTLANCVALPHIGSATVKTRREMARLAAVNLVTFLQGKTPPHCVNPSVLEGV